MKFEDLTPDRLALTSITRSVSEVGRFARRGSREAVRRIHRVLERSHSFVAEIQPQRGGHKLALGWLISAPLGRNRKGTTSKLALRVWLLVLAILICFNPTPIRAAERTEQEKQIDTAISRALEHIASKQQPSGAWVIDQFGESTAATSLAVMAFMSAGHVPGEGPYDQHIQRGIRWVLDHQQQSGLLVHRTGNGPMYCHGISTLMLAEVAGMTDTALAEPCRTALTKAVRLILTSQSVHKDRNQMGGWRYNPGSNDSDLSVTGWQLLALRAAKNLGCDVPAEYIDLAVDYVKRCSVRGGGFAYQPGSGPSATRTGTGILCLEICGVHHSPETLSGATWLIQRPLQVNEEWFYYGAYYGTIGMFQVGGDQWARSKEHMIPLLLNLQTEDGSWTGRNGQERGMGTIYCTSLSVLALSVEYQFLPIYQR